MREPMYDAVLNVHDHLVHIGVNLPDELKLRDPREPGRREKMMYEDRIMRILLRYWRKQARIVKDRLEYFEHNRTLLVPPYEPVIEPAFADDIDDELEADLQRTIGQAANHGILLFGAGLALAFNDTIAKTKAMKWVHKHVGEFIKQIGDTTRKALQDLIGVFVATPDMTLSDLWWALPFDERRARVAAVTEVTNVYGQVGQISGQEFARQYPRIHLARTWYTEQDDRVCEICAPLDGMTVAADDFFTTEGDQSLGLEGPPAHINCRCWVEYDTGGTND